MKPQGRLDPEKKLYSEVSACGVMATGVLPSDLTSAITTTHVQTLSPASLVLGVCPQQGITAC